MADEKVDPTLVRELQKVVFSAGISGAALKLTSQCFEVCYGSYSAHKIPNRMSDRDRQCVENCTQRIVDAQEFLEQHLGKMRIRM